MTALIVGGDRLGKIPNLLRNNGIDQYIHWSGRKKGMRNKALPQDVDMIIVLYDFIEHNLVNIIKKESRIKDIPCIFSRRAGSDLSTKLDICSRCKKCSTNK